MKLLTLLALFSLPLNMIHLPFLPQPIDHFSAHPPFHLKHLATTSTPSGLSPQQVKLAYNLPRQGGQGTIAIIDVFDSPMVESDLQTFSRQYNLPGCTTENGCFEKHRMATRLRTDSGWALEAALDTQWAHAIAPQAKILLVEARSSSGNDLLAALNYARNRSDVTAVSMSWGGSEFSGEASLDTYFTSPTGASFFASSGDNGTGASWPSISPNVVAVGGTTLTLSGGNVQSETAWSGSGGGSSLYEPAPSYQATYGVPSSNGKRAVPDVSYNADPATGFSVYDSTSYQNQAGWFTVGGTSAGAPQWAAISTLGNNFHNATLYRDGSQVPTLFRDITTGSNGACAVFCSAGPRYDFVTGLGSPLSPIF